MRGTHEKITAVGLAAIMVLSVFVAPAAAQASQQVEITETDEPGSAAAGGEITVTYDVQVTEEDGGVTVSLNGLPSSYTVSDVSGDVVANSSDGTQAQLATDQFVVPAGETATVTFTIQVPDDAETGDVSWTALAEAGQSDDTDEETSTLTVEEEDEEDDEEQPPDDGGDEELDETTTLVDGGTFFVGQTLVTDEYDSDDNVRLEDGDGNFESDIDVDSSGTAAVDTAQLDLSAGNYQLVSSTDDTVEFELAEQRYAVSPATANVTEGSTADITVSSNRNGYVHVVSSPDIDAEDLAGLLSPPDNLEASVQDADGDDENEVVLQGGSLEDVVTANFTGVDPGTYTIDFEVFDTGVSDSITVNVEDAAPGDASFTDIINSEQRGDVAEIPVELENTDSATVFLGSQEVNYLVSLEVTDGDDDGAVTVEWNTDRAGQDETGVFDTVSDDDSVSAERIAGGFSDSDRRLAATGYPLNATVSGDETDVGTVNLQNPSGDISLETRRARGAVDDEDISVDNTNVANTVASGDNVVVRVSGVQSVFGYVSSSDDLPAQGVDISVEQTSLDDNEEPDEVDVSDLTLRASGDSDQVLLIGSADQFEIGETYDVTFSIDSDDNPYFTEDTELTQSVTFQQRSVSLDVPGDQLRLQQKAAATVSGTTTVADGTTLTVTIRSTNQDNPILESQQVEVQDGSFAATFDLSGSVAGQSVTVTVRESQGASTTSESGVITEPANVDASGASIADSGQIVTGVNAFLPNGGFVTIHDSSLQDGAVFDSVRGTSKYFTPGQVNNISIALDDPYQGGSHTIIAMAHQDTNGNAVYDFLTSDGSQDGPYVLGGSAVTASAEVTVSTPTTTTTTPTTTTPTTTTPTTTTPTTTTPTTTTTEPTETTNGEDSPGFGVAVALIALLAAALLATRRRDE